MPVRLGQVLRIGPVRAVGMGCHGLLLSAITGTFSGIVVISVACPLLYASVFGASILGAVGGSAGPSGAIISMLTLVVSISFLAVLLLTSSTFASLAYAVQAFALEDRAVGSSITRSIDLLLFRFGRSILVFVGAGAIIGTLLIAYLGTLFAGGYALLDWLDIELSPIARQALSGVASALTWVVLLPPLAIWMAMLHRSLAHERDAPELVAAVETWRTKTNE
jgi:hypothetical protein